MEINQKVIEKNFPQISNKLNLEYFNSLSITDKKDILLQIANITANCLDIKLDLNKILFVNHNEIGIGNASFSFYENIIRLNNELLNGEMNIYNFMALIDNTVHEVVHFCQKEHNILIQHLSTPLPRPYRTYQPHELQAYKISENILDEFKKFINDKEIISIIDLLKDARKSLQLIDSFDLSERHYSNKFEDIENQIEIMLPFYKNVTITERLDEDHKLDIKISKLNQHIDAIFMNDEGIFGKLSVCDINEINKLNFTIKNNICYINEIVKLNNNNIYEPVSKQNKEKLMSILNNIIKTANKIELCNCTNYIINPISIIDIKEEHDKFIKDIINGNIKLSTKITDISTKQIEKTFLKNIDNER